MVMKYSGGSLCLLNLERPAFNGHIPSCQEVFKVFPVDAVVAAGKAECLEPVALYPFQHGALANLTICGDVFGC